VPADPEVKVEWPDLVVVVAVAGRVVVAAVAVVAVVVAVAAEHSNFGSTLPKHYNHRVFVVPELQPLMWEAAVAAGAGAAVPLASVVPAVQAEVVGAGAGAGAEVVGAGAELPTELLVEP
jgi:hypothetical protein